jgi:DNA repair exonuclease SbcCD nuclease subunit
MKIAILGDTHFGMRGDSLHFHRHYELFYENIFFPYLKQNNITTIIQLGDLFDRRKFINFNSLHLARKYFFNKLKENNLQFFTLLGNHDIAYKNTLEVNSSGLLLNDYDNIKILSEFHTEEFDGVPIDFVPWICDENETEIFNQMKSSKSQICMGHFEIDGFEMDRGNIHQGGLDRIKLNKYDVVLSGHFHHKSTADNIVYVGTPGEITWSDYDDERGFHVFDTTDRSLKFIKNPYTIFKKIFYNDIDQTFEYWKDFDFSSFKETYVKIVVINKTNPYLFDNVLDNLYKIGTHDISIVEDFNDVTSDIDDDIVDQAEDTMTILSKYIDNLPMSVEPDKLKTLMRELYVEALNTETTE